MSLERPILEYGASCWDPYSEIRLTRAKESGLICKPYERFGRGNLGAV